jgi:hypothetical protein
MSYKVLTCQIRLSKTILLSEQTEDGAPPHIAIVLSRGDLVQFCRYSPQRMIHSSRQKILPKIRHRFVQLAFPF